MKRHEGIAYGPVAGYAALLAGSAAALGWAVTSPWYPLAILFVPLLLLALYRLLRLYGSSIRRVTFMFNAVDNDDLTFRFNDDPSKVDSAMLNAALNRIKEILLRAKMRAEERERYYQLIMECAQTGLITINDTGSVYQANGEALRIFGMQRMTHIRQLETSAPEACRALAAIRPGEKLRVTCVTESREMALTLGCSEIVLEKQRLRVVTVGDINSELNEMQIESWSKLTRILTHEIMNSLAPVTSLSDTLLHLGRPLDRDVEQGLDTISALHADPRTAEGAVRGAGAGAAGGGADRGRGRRNRDRDGHRTAGDTHLRRQGADGTGGGQSAQERPRGGGRQARRTHRNQGAHRRRRTRRDRNKQQRRGA